MQSRANVNEAYLTENGMFKKKKKKKFKNEAHTRYGNIKTQYYKINNSKPQTFFKHPNSHTEKITKNSKPINLMSM